MTEDNAFLLGFLAARAAAADLVERNMLQGGDLAGQIRRLEPKAIQHIADKLVLNKAQQAQP